MPGVGLLGLPEQNAAEAPCGCPAPPTPRVKGLGFAGRGRGHTLPALAGGSVPAGGSARPTDTPRAERSGRLGAISVQVEVGEARHTSRSAAHRGGPRSSPQLPRRDPVPSTASPPAFHTRSRSSRPRSPVRCPQHARPPRPQSLPPPRSPAQARVLARQRPVAATRAGRGPSSVPPQPLGPLGLLGPSRALDPRAAHPL